MSTLCIFIIVIYTINFVFCKEISFRDVNIQYYGRWQSNTDEIRQSGWPGAYFRVVLDKTRQVKLKVNKHTSFSFQLNNQALIAIQTNDTVIDLFPNGLDTQSPNTLTVYSTRTEYPFAFELEALIVEDTGITLPVASNPIVEYIGHELLFAQDMFKSYPLITSRNLIGLEYSLIAYRHASLINGLDQKYFENKPRMMPWSIVILLGANDDHQEQYRLALERFLTKTRTLVNENTPIFILSEPLGDMYYPSQQSVLNRNYHGDQYVFFIDTTSWLRYGPKHYIDQGRFTDAGHELFAKRLAPYIQTKLNRPKDPLPGPPPNPNLPGDWQTMDIGEESMIGLPGTVSSDSSTTFTLWGSGADIDNEKDGFRFLYQPFSSQGKLESTIQSHSTFAKCAKAGIMIREHLGQGSPFIMLGISPADGIFLETRNENFETAKMLKKTRASPPYRLRLVRQKERFMAQIQLVDTMADWETFYSFSFGLAQDVYAGLAVTSCDTSVVSVAKFTQVQLYHTVGSLLQQQ